LKCSVQDDLVKPILINVMLCFRLVQKKLFSSFFSIGYFQLDRLHFFVPILSCFCLSSPWISIFIYLGFFMSARSWPWTVGPTAQIFWPFDFVFHHFLTSWHLVDLTRIMNQKVFTLLPAKICFETEGVDLRRYFKYLNNYFASHPF
jgi:hypothetical protein